ncbi:hypothetical protein SAMN04487970_104055 [Paenibacillus tianmuensis]|uniref:Uncharacterized protein n=1 Tax=Paenibacillus tianmuensis TaxID=624147 RepID=A0A1G4T4I7_9BACL|nr:hypothetical protein [Paenibacillus tianmuensis]SCW75439.1 hypothetical protein SAMN04487970_104055 [Paenibacillus tianmuensis]
MAHNHIPAILAASLAALTLAASQVASAPNLRNESVSSAQVATPTAPVVVGKPQGQANLTVSFVDVALKQNRNTILTPQGNLTEQYAYSTYSVPYKVIEDGNDNVGLGPREQDSFLCSAPKGGTSTIVNPVEVRANVQIQSYVGMELRKLIHLIWTNQEDGSFKHVYSKTKVYPAPESAPYHRDYYRAIQYDLGTTIVNRTDVYHVYSGNNHLYATSYTSQQKIYAKIPKAIEYAKDF